MILLGIKVIVCTLDEIISRVDEGVGVIIVSVTVPVGDT